MSYAATKVEQPCFNFEKKIVNKKTVQRRKPYMNDKALCGSDFKNKVLSPCFVKILGYIRQHQSQEIRFEMSKVLRISTFQHGKILIHYLKSLTLDLLLNYWAEISLIDGTIPVALCHLIHRM